MLWAYFKPCQKHRGCSLFFILRTRWGPLERRGFIPGLGPAEGSPRESVPQGFLVSEPLFSPIPPVWGLLFSRCLRSLIEPRRGLYIFNVHKYINKIFLTRYVFYQSLPSG